MRYILVRLLVMAALTALFIWLAYKERGYFAIGIEWIIIPTILFIKEAVIEE